MILINFFFGYRASPILTVFSSPTKSYPCCRSIKIVDVLTKIVLESFHAAHANLISEPLLTRPIEGDYLECNSDTFEWYYARIGS